MRELKQESRPLAPLHLPPLTERRLANGLSVTCAERRRLPLVSVCLVMPGGSARDPRGKAGLADFVVELLRRGTRRRDADQIDEALELMGVDLRLETAPDSAYLSATAPSEHLAPMLELLAEFVTAPAFPAAEVKLARARLLARLQTELDEPQVVASDAIFRAALGKHPYAHAGRGVASEVASFNRDDCRHFFEQAFRPAGAHLVVVGDSPADEALALVERHFGGWAGGAAPFRKLPAVQAVPDRRILLVDKPGANQAQIRLASAGPGRLDPALLQARVASQVFGGGFTSRLVDAVRVTRGLTYGISSFVSENEAGGLFLISTFTRNESVRELFDVVLAEAEHYRSGGPDAEELERTKRHTNGLFPLALETVEQLARALADLRRFGREPDWLERYRERIAAVSAAQALEQARRFMLAPTWCAAVVGDAKALAGQLQGLGKVRRVAVEELA